MKIYKETNVFDEALNRIRFLFDEFENVVVANSGGKDSTVVLQLAMMVAQEKNRLPLKVLFIDQEAEWQMVIDHVRETMADERVEPIWLQVPFKIFNATSSTEQWLHCWEEGKEWIREKEPNSIHENTFGTDRFAKLFDHVLKTLFPDKKTCILGGVRTDESPTRFVTTTQVAKYKHITYGKRVNEPNHEHYVFYPIYDWGISDVWTAIHRNQWPYCPVYNEMYRHGVQIQKMRVSNLNHETAIETLMLVQEIEPETWERLTARLQGVNTASQLKGDGLSVTELPYMFRDWKEYRDYLNENLITDPKARKIFSEKFNRMEAKYQELRHHKDKMYIAQISAILTNDWNMTKITNWENRFDVQNWRKFQKGVFNQFSSTNKYING